MVTNYLKKFIRSTPTVLNSSISNLRPLCFSSKLLANFSPSFFYPYSLCCTIMAGLAFSLTFRTSVFALILLNHKLHLAITYGERIIMIK